MSIYGSYARTWNTICFQRQERTYGQGKDTKSCLSKTKFDIKVPYDLKKYAVVPGSIKITFNLYIESRNEKRRIANNVGRTLVKKVVMPGSKETDRIKNTDVYDTYKDLYLSKKNVKRSCFRVYNQ